MPPRPAPPPLAIFHRRTISASLAAVLCCLCSVLHAQTAATLSPAAGVQNSADQAKFFREQVSPLLQAKCYGCHSHESQSMDGGLTLDWKQGWQQGGGRGPAVVPGQPGRSLLIRAVRRADTKLQMPPDDPLSAEDIKVLTDWVAAGAFDPREQAPSSKVDPLDWWSLRPLTRPPLPENGASHPIDAFIDRRLADEDLAAASGPLQAAPQADRRTLIRRLTMDLHGLLPSPEEVEAFASDSSPDAYERLVDRLLASPRYGQRWARHWLDVVHFADSHGCEHDVFRPHAWRYRDYVIDSFNQDTSWRRFIREQLAADVFFPHQPALRAALGYIAAGPLELSRAGTAPVTFDYLDRDDIVTQVMASFTSTTANCARCHHHKFDPVSQADYYALQAVFAGGGKGAIEFDLSEKAARQREHWQSLAKAAADRGPVLLESRWAPLLKVATAALAEAPRWTPVHWDTFLSQNGSRLTKQEDNSIFAHGERPATEVYTLTVRSSLPQITALRLDVLPDERLPSNGPGRCDNGNLHLNEVEFLLLDSADPEASKEPSPLRVSKAQADWDQTGWTIQHAIDGNPATAWGIHPKVGVPHHAVFQLESPVALTPTSRIVVRLHQTHGGSHLIGRFQLSATDAATLPTSVVPVDVQAALATPATKRSEQQQLTLASHVLAGYAQQQLESLHPPASVYGWSDHYSHAKRSPTAHPIKTVHVLKRGLIDQPGAVADPGALSAIDELPGRFRLPEGHHESARRAALADWLAAKENPLTWRSVVNRVWHYHFGRGISATTNDFGRMGAAPSHAALLDWLAIWFRDDADGSLKRLHRLILTSDAWQRSSRLAPDAASGEFAQHFRRDAGNRLLWRRLPRPLDAGAFRDVVLQVAGRLDETHGGPGIMHFTQSKGQQVTPQLHYDQFDWNASASGRRSIYRVVWRGIPDPFLDALDFPDLGLLTGKRESSVSALQSLALLNNSFVLHHSEALAARLQRERAALPDQLERAWQLAFQQSPAPEALDALQLHAEQHGLAAACRLIFNTNAFMFID